MHLPRLLPFLSLAAAVAAQTVATFPSDHATITNGTGGQNWFPYSNGVSRGMAVYEAWDVTVPAGRQITRIGFRSDGATVSTGRALQLEVRMGQTQRTAADLLSNYDNNWLGQPTTVFGPALFTLPDLNVVNPSPNGQFVWLQLTTPFTWNPSGNLLIEWRVLANNNGGAAFNYRLDQADFVSPLVSGPAGCPHSGNQTPRLQSRATRVGATWFNDLSMAPANQLVVMFLNINQPLQTPYPLAPYLPGISPACQGQVSPTGLLSLTNTTTASGARTFSVAIPNDRVFNDTILTSQVVCLDFFAPGGVAVSNGDQCTVGIDPAMSVLWSQGNATATTGTIYRNYGIVTFFDHN